MHKSGLKVRLQDQELPVALIYHHGGKNMALKDIICQLCDPGKFTGVLKCPHGKYFTRYTEKALEAAAERAIKELGGN